MGDVGATPIWLHERTGNETGWLAWSLEHLGFATWAPTRAAVVARAPGKLREYVTWSSANGIPAAAATLPPVDVVTVVEHVAGDEIAFAHDRLPAASAEIRRCLALLRATRNDLLRAVDGLPDELLDFDPRYRRFAPWARWRTIREVMTHIAATEVGYYLPLIGYAGPAHDPLAAEPWRELLERGRAETVAFLETLVGSDDRLRLTDGADETWSVRKVLRRLVWHERLHAKSIGRIVSEAVG